MDDFHNQRITVLGLGHFGGGSAVARWLVNQGARVTVSDISTAEKLKDSLAALAGLPIEFHLGPDQSEKDFTGADLIVASPAIPPHHPYLQAARNASVPITTEICLFVQRCPAQMIGVTGTKGKSTTSTLLHRMLSSKRNTWFGGNIGRSLLPDLPTIKPDDLVVLELSSFMLDHLGKIGWSPHVAVVTMVSTDHLDWHGSQENYVAAKANLVRFQKPGDFAVMNAAVGRSLSPSSVVATPASLLFSGAAESDAGVAATNAIAVTLGPTAAMIVPIPTEPRFSLRLAGEHNQFNAQAAFAAASLFGIDWATAQTAIADFTGLDHRLQLVHVCNGVRFINDSISTIPEAAIAALNSFPPHRVIQIVGGSAKKHLPVDEMCKALAERAKGILCIGETADAIAAFLPAERAQICRTLDVAIHMAKQLAVAGDIVLLSPGHPSYDQFTNFEARGAEFTRLCRME